MLLMSQDVMFEQDVDNNKISAAHASHQLNPYHSSGSLGVTLTSLGHEREVTCVSNQIRSV